MRVVGLLLFLFFPIKFFGQINPADSTVQVIAYWDKAERHTYALTWQKLKVTGKDTVVTMDISYKADMTVTDSTASGYTVEWKYKDYSFGNSTGKKIEESGMGSMVKSIQNKPVHFTTDENGSFTALTNWEEIRDMFKETIDFAASALKLPEEYKAYTNNLTRSHIEELTIKDVQIFCMFYGVKLNLGVPIENEVDGGSDATGSIKSDVSLLLQAIDFDESLYEVSFYQNYDEAAIQKLLGTLLDPLLTGVVPDNEKDKFSKMKFSSFEDFYNAVFHDSGWPVSMQHDRVVMFENNEQGIERRTIQLVE
jgi:hypothetical protein